MVKNTAVASSLSPLDTQQIEILGRNLVKAALIEAGVEVATPERDNGIDLIAYRWSLTGKFIARPIQLKAASDFSFGIDRKYERIPGLLMVYVTGVRSGEHRIFAMTYSEVFAIAERLKWTKTPSWTEGDGYSTRNPGKRVVAELATFEVQKGSWERFFDGTS